MEKYCIYLRKSRKDLQAESSGEGETLKRHEDMLYRLSARLGIIVEESAVYREIVSGETISARPEMQRLLADVEQGKWAGVLVAEVERLARGDTIDQGIVSQVFKFSGTKIITPTKIYDPSDEFDEEYFEFGLFMSRREYKKINQRMNNGRIASVNEGKYVGNKTPYGFDRVKIKGEKGFELVPNDEAEAVKLAFRMYAYEEKSKTEIADKLTELNFKPRENIEWSRATITSMLNNPVYIGKIRWGHRSQVKKTVDGKIKVSRPRSDDNMILARGRHEPLIDEQTWGIVQNKREYYCSKVPHAYAMQNPLAGVLICEKCGGKMKRRPYPTMEAHILCDNPKCDNISSKLSIVEIKLLKALSYWLKDYVAELDNTPLGKDVDYVALSERAIDEIHKELQAEEKRYKNICIAYEDGTYTRELFIQRSIEVKATIEGLNNQIIELEESIQREKEIRDNRDSIIPRIENIMSVYDSGITVEEKNRLLKSVLEKVTYIKTERSKKGSDCDNFELHIYPKVLKK